MRTIELELTGDDCSTITQYKTSVERAKGYTGRIIINTQRLAELHEENAWALVQVALFRIKHGSKQSGKKQI
ncbi:hypothetical protein HHX48_17530 [Salinimonas sp. HHU 13199]|uniref:Uncharacterized protein n=1 Tax=Salinimonas profundi TaxID=2729140 RepID=A0ABR8LPK5_9ALTE|nr:hypothetical protein [Salinimonas profundi]MBD3587543.1 hypothetical protein [Salinimonas profundi]